MIASKNVNSNFFEVLNFTLETFLKLKYLDIYRILLISSFNVSEKLDIYTKRMCDAVSMALSRKVDLWKEK
jgi:hypothetical protein